MKNPSKKVLTYTQNNVILYVELKKSYPLGGNQNEHHHAD